MNQPHASVAPNQRKLLVMGMGVTGLSVARWCARNDVAAMFVDSRDAAPGANDIAALLPDADIRCGDLPHVLPDGISEIILSPGLPLDLPLLDAAARAGIAVHSDIDLFFSDCKQPVIGITGSNGKSTVTSMLGEMLRAAGMNAAVGGNLGAAALDLLTAEADFYVLELSSFQLERSDELPLHAAVVLNLSNDHLDHHGDMQSYGAAKARIYQNCRFAVVNRDEPELAVSAESCTRQRGFTLSQPAPEEWGVVVKDDGQWIARGTYTVMPVSALQIAGRHNLANALAAFALADTLELPLDGLVAGAQVFPGLPHRMQRVASDDGIIWINDSKATNEAAAIASIESVFDGLSGRLVLIAGGDAKSAELKDLALCLEDKDVLVILLGKDRDLLHERLDSVCKTLDADTMAEAVSLAASHVTAGDTVLLAPACSSLDMYVNFEQRGESFASAVAGVQK
ncbi:MAG: UDP-N-acetylmuramoyl-L-alanine--D-glutamate ligase [Gammaproteobacteria bacterium]|nr:UDP-N-acetylmuramoyl-L-alanine--D-glutamate ligase [Gammaproteobacteria bacterium]